jgi:hypothetical protein
MSRPTDLVLAIEAVRVEMAAELARMDAVTADPGRWDALSPRHNALCIRREALGNAILAIEPRSRAAAAVALEVVRELAGEGGLSEEVRSLVDGALQRVAAYLRPAVLRSAPAN